MGSERGRHEIKIKLRNGGTLRCGHGEDYPFGGYLRICDRDGRELLYWDKVEWAQSPEQVIGAIFIAANSSISSLRKLKRDRRPVS